MTARTKYCLILITVIAFYVGASAAQVSNSNSNSSTQTQRGTISGIVVRAGSGEPVRKALVSLRVVNQAATGLAPANTNTQQTQQRGAQEAQGQQGNRGQGNGNRGQQQGGNGGNNNGGGRQGQQNRGGGPGQSSLSTGDDGAFVFSNVNPGQYRVSVERDGYIRQEFGQRSWTGPGTIITVAPGQMLNNVSFQLVPAGTIAGRIVDEHGEALAGIQVQALSYTYRDGNRTLTPSRQVQTNDLGEYRLYWLTPGEYYVTAIPNNALDRLLQTVATIDLASVARGGNAREALAQAVRQPTSTTAAPEESYAPTYFPGAIDPDAAAPVKLAAAAEIRGIDFTLKPVRTLKLRGRVIAVDVPLTAQQLQAQAQQQQQAQAQRGGRGGGGGRGGPGGGSNILDLLGGRGGARGVQVLALRNDAPAAGGRGGGRRGGPAGVQNRASVGADGTFEISNVIPGSYTVIGVQQANNQVFSAQAKVEAAGADVDNITLALRPGISISGQIYVDGQTPPQNFRMEQLRVTLSPVDDVPLGNANAQVKADGTFVLNNVGAMTYRVSINGLGNGSYLAAGRYGNAEALNDLLQAGDQSLPLALQLGFSPGRVDGVVNDNRDQPYPGVTCVLVPAARNRIDLYKTASTDQYGRFTFANVVPGDYKVFAWEDIPQGAYMDSAYVSKFDDRGIAAHVEKGGGVSVQVRVIPAER